MAAATIAAVIIATVTIVAAIVAAPHLAPASYQISSPGDAIVAFRVNTRTGEVRLCVPYGPVSYLRSSDIDRGFPGEGSTSCSALGGP